LFRNPPMILKIVPKDGHQCTISDKFMDKIRNI
jgi:hypothetical protein